MEFLALGIIRYAVIKGETAQTEVDQIMFTHNLFFPSLAAANRARFRAKYAIHFAPATIGHQHIFPVNRVNRARRSIEVLAQIVIQFECVTTDGVTPYLQDDLVAAGGVNCAAG